MSTEATSSDTRESKRSANLPRRLISVPTLFVAFAIVTASLPLLVVTALLFDTARSVRRSVHGAATRLTLFLWCYLASEVIGVIALFGLWAWTLGGIGSRHERLVDGTYAVQRLWAGTLFRIARSLFALRFAVEGDACVTPGPMLVFIRHASLVDTLLPTVFVTAAHGIRLRFVLKRELLVDPCLDIAGHRLPNCFVARDGKETATELEGVRALANGLTSRDGILIYPEGTRFTPSKQARALERIATSDPARHARLRTLRALMPPRTGGALTLLDATSTDIVIFAHKGLGGFAEWHDIWRGGLVGRTVFIKMWRIPRAEIPSTREARIEWLDAQWHAIDRWIADE